MRSKLYLYVYQDIYPIKRNSYNTPVRLNFQFVEYPYQPEDIQTKVDGQVK